MFIIITKISVIVLFVLRFQNGCHLYITIFDGTSAILYFIVWMALTELLWYGSYFTTCLNYNQNDILCSPKRSLPKVSIRFLKFRKTSIKI